MFNFIFRHKRALSIALLILALIGVALGVALTATGVLSPLGITLKIFSIHLGLQGAALIATNAAFSMGIATLIPTLATITIAAIVDGSRFIGRKIKAVFMNKPVVTASPKSPRARVSTQTNIKPAPAQTIAQSVKRSSSNPPIMFKPRKLNISYYWKMWFTKDSSLKITMQAQQDIHFAYFLLNREKYRKQLTPLQIAQIFVKHKAIEGFIRDPAIIQILLKNEAAADLLLENMSARISDAALIMSLSTHTSVLLDKHSQLLANRLDNPNFITLLDDYINASEISCYPQAKENIIISLMRSNTLSMLDAAKTSQFINLILKFDKDKSSHSFLLRILASIPHDIDARQTFYQHFYSSVMKESNLNKQLAEQLLKIPAVSFLNLQQRIGLLDKHKDDYEFVKQHLAVILTTSDHPSEIDDDLKSAYAGLFKKLSDENIADLLETCEINQLHSLIVCLEAAGLSTAELLTLNNCANAIFNNYHLYSTVANEQLINAAIHHGLEFIFEHFDTIIDIIGNSSTLAKLVLSYFNSQIKDMLAPLTISSTTTNVMHDDDRPTKPRSLEINPILDTGQQKLIETLFYHLASMYQTYSGEAALQDDIVMYHEEAAKYFMQYAYTHIESIPRLLADDNKDRYDVFISKQSQSELIHRYLNNELEKSKNRLYEEETQTYDPRRFWGREPPLSVDARKLLSQQIETACQAENVNSYAWRQSVINLLTDNLHTLNREQIANLLLAYMDSFFESEFLQHQEDKQDNNRIVLRDIILKVFFNDTPNSAELLPLDMALKLLENPQVKNKLSATELSEIRKMYDSQFYAGFIRNATYDKSFKDESDKLECFKTLELKEDATVKDLQHAYKKQSTKYHPDKFNDPSEKSTAEEKFKMVGRAYEKLNRYIKLKDATAADVATLTADNQENLQPPSETASQSIPIQPPSTSVVMSKEEQETKSKRKKIKKFVSHFFKSTHSDNDKVRHSSAQTDPILTCSDNYKFS